MLWWVHPTQAAALPAHILPKLLGKVCQPKASGWVPNLQRGELRESSILRRKIFIGISTDCSGSCSTSRQLSSWDSQALKRYRSKQPSCSKKGESANNFRKWSEYWGSLEYEEAIANKLFKFRRVWNYLSGNFVFGKDTKGTNYLFFRLISKSFLKISTIP